MKFRLLAVVCAFLLCVLPAIAGEIYNNGPINGETDAFTINFGFTVADSFTISTPSATLGRMDFGAWLFPGDVLQTVELLVTTDPLGGVVFFDQEVSFTASGCSSNQYGFNVCTETGFFNGPTLAEGTYWVQLQNAVVNTGDPVYWDENSGVGCTSQGCPSEASIGSCTTDGFFCVPSEAFRLSSSGSTVPEPDSFALFGSGVLSVVALVRRRFR